LAAAVLLLVSLVGCGDDDDGDDDGDKRPAQVGGTFVGKVPGTEALVAVVAAPPVKGQDGREVNAFVCDARRLCARFSGSTTGNRFVATSGDEGETKGRLSGGSATGSVELPDGKPLRYRAAEATATAGLYDLTVSAAGKVSGASAAGVGIKGEMTLPAPGSGRLKLADGTRLRFNVTRKTAGDTVRLRAGQVLLIVLPGGQLTGAGKGRKGGDSEFFIRSASGPSKPERSRKPSRKPAKPK
jgi:hypothetical protein